MKDSTGRSILITGATGDIGRRLVALLHEAGQPVVAMCRKPQQIEEFRSRGIAAVYGDLEEPESVRSALVGCDRMFLLTSGGPKQQEHGITGAEAAQAVGVRHVVHLSTADANPNSAIPWASAPAHTDAVLKQRSGDWTILRPSAFMQNLVQSAALIKRGVLPQTTGRGVLAWIDTQDIARVASVVLTEDGHHGKEYYLTGPEAMTTTKVAAELSSVTGRKVRYLHLPGPLFFVAMRLGGLDPWTARGLVHQFVDVVRKGRDLGDLQTNTVHALTGSGATDLRSFLTENRSVFTA